MEKMKYYLYVKTSPLGLKYLGKTIKNPYLYKGSDKIWKRHLLKHKYKLDDVKTEIILVTTDINELIRVGNEFSVRYDIVNSNEWVNLRIENGDGGDIYKFIDYLNPNFHKSDRAKHLNTFKSDDDKKRIITKRTSKIDYNNPERLKKIKENTDWDSWRESIKKRKIDYVNMKRNVVNKRPIIQLDLYGNVLNKYTSVMEAAKKLNIGRSGIIQCLRKRNKTAFGYKWEYDNE